MSIINKLNIVVTTITILKKSLLFSEFIFVIITSIINNALDKIM